jgi:hypothetical protein
MLLDAVIARISGQLDSLAQSQQRTQAGATHEETRAEDPKDTRATEASYLARGLAERVEQLRGDLDRLRALSLRDFGADSPVGLGALVRVEEEYDEEETEKSGPPAGSLTYFLLPAGGGESLIFSGTEVRVLSPSSPLGRKILGTELGDEFEVDLPRGRTTLSIVELA